MASNTKTYVAAAMLRLAELGRLDLDDSLGKHLSGKYKALLADDGYDLQTITLRQMLGHTSGLFEHPADPRYEEQILADPQHVWTAEEQVTRCVEWGDPVGAPGEKFSYSDTGYILLGSIIEKLTGKNLGASVHQLCDYEALGLGSTWWEIMEEAPSGAGPRAHQYFEDIDTTDWHPGLDLYGGGGTPDYRLGLICAELGGHVAYGHTGFWNTFAFHVPALDLTVSGCLLNHHAARGQELADELVKVVGIAAGGLD